MSKKTRFVLLSLLAFPIFASAVWWNPLTWFSNDTAVGVPTTMNTRHFLPFTDSAYDIGTTSQAYRDLYVDQLCLTADTCYTSITAGSGGGDGNDVSTSTAETAGQVPYWTTTSANQALLTSIATSSVTISSPLTESGTAGYVIGGSGWTLDFDFSLDNAWTGVGTTTFAGNIDVASNVEAGAVQAVTSTSTFTGIRITELNCSGFANGGKLTISASTGAVVCATDNNSAGSDNIATSTAETATQVAVWSSTSATPATLASYSNLTFNSTTGLLTTTFASTTAVSGQFLPITNNVETLGISGTAFADLFLGDGSVINFNASDVTLTHSSNLITITGGTTALDSGSTIGNLTLANGSITDSGGSISFGNENLTTTGTLASGALTVTGAALPNTDDGGALGASGTAWSDLFLASGGVLNWNAGDITLTHSSDTLTFANGVFAFTSTSTFSGTVGFTFGSTTAANTQTIDWATGSTQRVIMGANTSFVINATSSHPVDGGRYVLKICQDNTGSRTATFITPARLNWWNGTTTVSSTKNYATYIGMVYDGRTQRYDVVASSTGLDMRSCQQ